MLRIVARLSARARAMPARSPLTNVTPALSIATSVPVPIATPTSASARHKIDGTDFATVFLIFESLVKSSSCLTGRSRAGLGSHEEGVSVRCNDTRLDAQPRHDLGNAVKRHD